jgi:hypothetical protein
MTTTHPRPDEGNAQELRRVSGAQVTPRPGAFRHQKSVLFSSSFLSTNGCAPEVSQEVLLKCIRKGGLSEPSPHNPECSGRSASYTRDKEPFVLSIKLRPTGYQDDLQASGRQFRKEASGAIVKDLQADAGVLIAEFSC